MNAENGKLAEMVKGLELRLGDKESVIRGLEERVKINQVNSFVLPERANESFQSF